MPKPRAKKGQPCCKPPAAPPIAACCNAPAANPIALSPTSPQPSALTEGSTETATEGTPGMGQLESPPCIACVPTAVPNPLPPIATASRCESAATPPRANTPPPPLAPAKVCRPLRRPASTESSLLLRRPTATCACRFAGDSSEVSGAACASASSQAFRFSALGGPAGPEGKETWYAGMWEARVLSCPDAANPAPPACREWLPPFDPS